MALSVLYGPMPISVTPLGERSSFGRTFADDDATSAVAVAAVVERPDSAVCCLLNCFSGVSCRRFSASDVEDSTDDDDCGGGLDKVGR